MKIRAINTTVNYQYTKIDNNELVTTRDSSNGDGLLPGRFEALVFAILIGVGEKILDVVDDGDVEGAARASRDLLAEPEVLLGDLEQVTARARVRVTLQLLVPLHVLDLHLVVRHRFALFLLSSSSFFFFFFFSALSTLVFRFPEEQRRDAKAALGFHDDRM